jgi:polygalacturonase
VTLFGSITYSDFQCDAKANWCTPLIDIAPNTDAPGSSIMGYGVIDGRGGERLIGMTGTWWDQDARPRLVYLGDNSTQARADNFTLYKITLKNSPKFHLSGIGNNLTVWGVKIIAPPDSPNTDGVDPSSATNVTITRSYISNGDDMIAIKAGNGHVSSVTISHLHTYSGHGISIGSETNAGADNVLVTDIVMDNGFGGSSSDSLRIKSDTSRGGEIRNVLYDGICILHGGNTLVFDPYYSSQAGNLIPNFHDITVRNLHLLVRDSSKKSTFAGYDTNGIVNPLGITLDNVVFDGWTRNDFQAPKMIHDVQFNLGPGPVNFASQLKTLAADPSNQIAVDDNIGSDAPPYDCPTSQFVYLAGELILSPVQPSPDLLTFTAILQNTVSPPVNGTPQYPQQNAPSGTISILDGDTVVATVPITGRTTSITIPRPDEGNHTFTAAYSGDGNFAPLNFGAIQVSQVGSPTSPKRGRPHAARPHAGSQ